MWGGNLHGFSSTLHVEETSALQGNLYRIVEWARREGDIAAISRMRVILLPLTVRERIVLDRVALETTCSPTYLSAARRAASDAVGKECPL